MRNFMPWGRIDPSVEKPTARTTIWRTLALFGLLFVIAFISAIIVTWWLINTSRLVGAMWVGPLIAAAVWVYGVKSAQLYPPKIEWKPQASQHSKQLLWLLGIAAACMLLYLFGYWPERAYHGGRLLWYVWQPMPRVEGGGVWAGIAGRAMQPVVSETALVWLRLIVAVTLPVALPYAAHLIWYRYGVEIVYPSFPDSVIARGLRFLDPIGLLDIHLPNDEEKPQPIQPSAEADGGGML